MTGAEMKELREQLGMSHQELGYALRLEQLSRLSPTFTLRHCEQGNIPIPRVVELALRYLVTCQDLVSFYEEEILS